jgi:hypothetical protein
MGRGNSREGAPRMEKKTIASKGRERHSARHARRSMPPALACRRSPPGASSSSSSSSSSTRMASTLAPRVSYGSSICTLFRRPSRGGPAAAPPVAGPARCADGICSCSSASNAARSGPGSASPRTAPPHPPPHAATPSSGPRGRARAPAWPRPLCTSRA